MTSHSPALSKAPTLSAAAILWLHYFWCLVPEWRLGEYYQYGFFVPPLFFALAWRRIQLLESADPWIPRPRVKTILIIAMLAFLGMLVPLRMIEAGDPSWRPPLLLHGAMVTAASHILLARSYGWRASWSLAPVTILAWAAVPYLGQVEQGLIRTLTSWVIGLTREAFLLAGYPVMQVGERLALGDRVVEVTDGCSGIRSFQSLVMTALFFGELLWLGWPRRIGLIVGALITAIVINTGRAFWLASLQFFDGPGAAHAAHDNVGHLAFAISATLLFGLAWLLVPRRTKGMKVRRIEVSARSTTSPDQA
ncbi:MAG TPA: exosortase/archaeosortase family protein [Haloferula sp.]